MAKESYKELQKTIYNIKFESNNSDDYEFYEDKNLDTSYTRRSPYLYIALPDFDEIDFYGQVEGIGDHNINSLCIQSVKIKELFTGFKVLVDIYIPFEYYKLYRNKSIKRVYEKTVFKNSSSYSEFMTNLVEDNNPLILQTENISEVYEYNNFLDVLTTPGQKYLIDFGWIIPRSNKYIGKSFQAVLVRSNLKFDQDTKGLKLSLTLASVYATILGNISVNSLQLDKQKVESIDNLTDMLDYLFESSRRHVKVLRGTYNNQIKKIDPELDIPYAKNVAYDLYSESDENKLKYLPDTLNSVSDSIKKNILNISSDESMTVLEVITRSCMENDLLARFTPLINNGQSRNAKQLIISNYSNNFDTISRKIYEPGTSVSESKDVLKVFEYDFDAFSRNSNILSLDIETESGEQSVATAYASSLYGSGEYDTFDLTKNSVKNINSYYDQWLKTSKRLSSIFVGNPSVDLWDLYKINFYDDIAGGSKDFLFSGYYKIMEISHSIYPGRFTTEIKAFKISNKMIVQNVEETSQSTSDFIRGSLPPDLQVKYDKVNEYFTNSRKDYYKDYTEDVNKYPKRYR